MKFNAQKLDYSAVFICHAQPYLLGPVSPLFCILSMYDAYYSGCVSDPLPVASLLAYQNRTKPDILQFTLTIVRFAFLDRRNINMWYYLFLVAQSICATPYWKGWCKLAKLCSGQQIVYFLVSCRFFLIKRSFEERFSEAYSDFDDLIRSRSIDSLQWLRRTTT